MGVGPIKSTRVSLPKQIIIEPKPLEPKPPTSTIKKKCPARRRSVSVTEQRRRSAELSDGYPSSVLKEAIGDSKIRSIRIVSEDDSEWAAGALFEAAEFQNVARTEARFPKIPVSSGSER